MKKSDIFHESLQYIHRKTRDILELVTKEDIEKIIQSFFKANRIFVRKMG